MTAEKPVEYPQLEAKYGDTRILIIYLDSYLFSSTLIL